MKFDEKALRASVIAHAIRLGKCPRPGMIMGCTLSVKQIEEDDFAAARLERATAISKPEPWEFRVAQEDIDAGRRLINDQAAVYREPKLTTVRIDP